MKLRFDTVRPFSVNAVAEKCYVDKSDTIENLKPKFVMTLPRYDPIYIKKYAIPSKMHRF